MLRSLTRLLACGLIAALALISQQPAPVFRAASKLVEVEVSVLDKDGNAVTGLTAADFTVHDEGKLRPVAFFRFDGAPPSAAVAPAPQPAPDSHPAPALVSNRVDPAGESPLNVSALVLDALNTAPEQNVQVRAQMMRYLKALAPRTRVAIFYMGQELRTLHDFTDDSASLRARLEKAAIAMPLDDVTDFTRTVIEAEQLVKAFSETDDPKQEGGIVGILRNSLAAESMANSAARARRMERTLAAMEALGKHLAGIPGRKSLVWIGGGFSMFSLDTSSKPPYTIRDDFEPKVRETSQRLAQEGVILYIVDSKGLQPPQDFQAGYARKLPQPGTGHFERQTDAETYSGDPRPAMNLMASITGGRYLFNTNDLSLGFQQVAADLRGSYTLGFYPSEEPDDQWHKLRVQVSRPKVEVHHRQGYVFSAASPQTQDWTADTWRAAFSNPVGSSAISLTAGVEPAPGDERRLNLAMGVDAIRFRSESGSLKADLQVGVEELAADGPAAPAFIAKLTVDVPASKWEEAGKTGLPFHRQWKPAPNTTRLRIVVLDVATGQYGSVDVKTR